MNVKQALVWARQELDSLPSPSLDGRLLLQYVLEKEASFLVGHPEIELSESQESQFKKLIQRRKACEPVSKLVGLREFYGRNFKVNQHVLDPRPDSETLIEAVLKTVEDKDAPVRLLELGVGSGCLLLTLLAQLPQAQGVGVDISEEALKVAQQNAQALSLGDRVSFQKSDLFESVGGRYDVILSNPPYIPTAEIESLEKDVRDFDPHLALDGGKRGLDFYARILAVYEDYLSPGGFLALEIGESQRDDVTELVKSPSAHVSTYKDLGQRDRCLIVRG